MINIDDIDIAMEIYLSENMELFWKNVTLRKEGVTQQDHWSGIGVIYFQ